MEPGDKVRREFTSKCDSEPKAESDRGSLYEITVKGAVPDDLVAKVSALHADAILKGRTVDGDESRS